MHTDIQIIRVDGKWFSTLLRVHLDRVNRIQWTQAGFRLLFKILGAPEPFIPAGRGATGGGFKGGMPDMGGSGVMELAQKGLGSGGWEAQEAL